jgi:hypothetical protein
MYVLPSIWCFGNIKEEIWFSVEFFHICVYGIFLVQNGNIWSRRSRKKKKGWLPPSWWIQCEVQEIITITEATPEGFIYFFHWFVHVYIVVALFWREYH